MIEAMMGSETENIRYCGTNPSVIERLAKAGLSRLCDAVCRNHERLMIRWTFAIACLVIAIGSFVCSGWLVGCVALLAAFLLWASGSN